MQAGTGPTASQEHCKNWLRPRPIFWQAPIYGNGLRRTQASRIFEVPSDALPNLPGGADVFLDANVFIYALGQQSAQCRGLLMRCAQEEVFGITTLEVINEVTHRLMLIEAVAKGLITRERAEDLKRNAAGIRTLTSYWGQAARIFSLNILLLGSNERRLQRAQAARATHGLLTNDSLIVAAMDEYGISSLATRDNDFDHLPHVVVYKPTDLP